MKKAVATLILFMLATMSAPVFCARIDTGPWQPFYEAPGRVAYAFTPVGIVHIGDHVQVRVRTVEGVKNAGKRVTTILYELDCRQRTFRTLEVVEEHEGLRSICKNPSDVFPIRPEKHPHLEKLNTRVCP
ncbi:MAG: hypothetical protein ACYC7J_15105 [Syntrophales bacterium]